MENQSFENREFAEENRASASLGRGLGVFSVGLGLAELVAPRAVSRVIGVDHCGEVPTTLRAFGVREILSGVGLLAKPDAPIGPWSRVLGDVMDMAFLGWALKSKSLERNRTVSAMAAVAGVMALDVFAGIKNQRSKLSAPVRSQITIARSPQEVYQVWRQFDRLPQFMRWVDSVQVMDSNRSHWVVSTPVGAKVEWDAEITEDIPGRKIAWRSLPGSTVPNRGSVTFLDAPGGRGCEVLVEMQFAAPLAKVFADQESQGDLRRFKQVIETGEVVYSDATIVRGKPHPAQPIEGGVR